MKKVVIIALSALAIFGLLGMVDAAAAAFPTGLGGTGTTASPAAGQVLIGTGSGAYTPAYILCAGTCSVSSASGTITITGTGVSTTTGNWQGTWQLYNPSDFLSSSTQVVNTVNGSSGTVTITSSTLGVVWPTVNGNKSAAYQITAGTGATTTISGATTTISVSLNNGVTQTCSANQFVDSVTSAGIANCGSITFPTAATYTFSAGPGISLAQATSSSNTTTTVTNTGVTSFTGQGCVTAANSTGSVALSVTCISGNQSISFTMSGDATGTATGTTAITDSITVTGLNGKALPANTTGTLQYSGGAWSISIATSSLGVYNANGTLSSYIGSTCGGSQYVTGISATGTVSCGTPPGTGLTGNGTSTYLAVYTASGTLAGYANLTFTSSTDSLGLPLANGSGTLTYSLKNDSSGYLEVNVTGTTPGNGTYQPYNIILQNCAAPTSTLSNSECDLSQAIDFPDGSRTFVDWNTQQYPPTYDSGWFETSSGGTASSSELYPFVLTFTPDTGGHYQVLTVTPVNATGTWNGVTFNFVGNIVATGTENLYNAGNGSLNVFNGSNTNYDDICLGNTGTTRWCLQLNPDGTNALNIVDPQNGGNVLHAVINGPTTIGNSGSGSGIILSTAATASTTLTVNQTSTTNGIVNTGNVSTTNLSANNIVVSGSSTAQSFQASSTAPSNFANENGLKFNILANYATAGCPWNTSITDLGGCIMAAYESVSSTASSTPQINVPILPPFTQYSTDINFNNPNEYVDLECAPGQILEYTGTLTATSGAVTYNEGDATTNNLKIAHLGGSNCHIALGGSTPAAGATSTAIYIGGTNGESAITLNNMGGIYAGIGLKEASNTFMATTNNFVADGDNQDFVMATGSNSGETAVNNEFHALDQANATTSTLPTCVQTGLNAFTELEFNGSNLDDCGATIGPTTGSFSFSGNLEDPAATGNTNYPKYPYITLQSSTALTATITGGINLDANSATSSPTSVIVNDANLTLTAVAVGRNGNQTATNLVDDSGNAASVITVQGLTYPASSFTNLVSSTNQVVPPQQSYTNATTTIANTLNVGTSTNLGATVNVWGNANSESIYSSNGNIVIGSGWGINTAGDGNNTGVFFNGTGQGFGVTSPATQVNVGASSTVRIGVSANTWSGCIEQYDHTNSSTLWYSYPNNGVYVNTTTKPAWCQ
jgi:trimeric autotransporter adhesin